MRDHQSTAACKDSLTGLGEADFQRVEALYPLVYDDLRKLAGNRMKREHAALTMQPTALVNEVYIKLVDQKDAAINSKTHFMAIASVAMQRILCDSARSRNAAKRGGGWKKVDIDGVAEADDDSRLHEAMAEAITALSEIDPRKAAVVRLRFLGGLTTVQIAEALGVARSTVDADWANAREWIAEHLAS